MTRGRPNCWRKLNKHSLKTSISQTISANTEPPYQRVCILTDFPYHCRLWTALWKGCTSLVCGQRSPKGICFGMGCYTLFWFYDSQSQMYEYRTDESCPLYVVFSHKEKDFLPIEKYWSKTGVLWKLFMSYDVLEVFSIAAGHYDMNTYQQCFMHNQHGNV